MPTETSQYTHSYILTTSGAPRSLRQRSPIAKKIWQVIHGSLHIDLLILISYTSNIETDIALFHRKGLIVLAGDFNARTGKENDFITDESGC